MIINLKKKGAKINGCRFLPSPFFPFVNILFLNDTKMSRSWRRLAIALPKTEHYQASNYLKRTGCQQLKCLPLFTIRHIQCNMLADAFKNIQLRLLQQKRTKNISRPFFTKQFFKFFGATASRSSWMIYSTNSTFECGLNKLALSSKRFVSFVEGIRCTVGI